MTPERLAKADKALALAKLKYPDDSLHVVAVELMSLPEADLDILIREAKMKRTLEVGCIVTHNGIGECVNNWSTVTPTPGHQGRVSKITKEYVWVAFTSYEGRCQAADLTVVMTPSEVKAAQPIIAAGMSPLPPGIPMAVTPSKVLPSNDSRITLATFAINTIYECFPTTSLSWDGWHFNLNAGFLQLTVDLGPLPPAHNYIPPLCTQRTNKTRNGFIKLSMANDATTAMLVLKVKDDPQAEVETKERMALHNDIPTDLQGWIFHAWNVWAKLLDTKLWKALGWHEIFRQSGAPILISPGEIVEITSDSRYFRLQNELVWNTVHDDINPLVSPEFIEVIQ